MPTPPEVHYKATIVIERTTQVPATMNARGYPEGGTPAHTKVETFEVPTVRARELDRLREKLGQYMDLVTDEDFGDEPKATRGDV